MNPSLALCNVTLSLNQREDFHTHLSVRELTCSQTQRQSLDLIACVWRHMDWAKFVNVLLRSGSRKHTELAHMQLKIKKKKI